jgi:hypothetical protein
VLAGTHFLHLGQEATDTQWSKRPHRMPVPVRLARHPLTLRYSSEPSPRSSVPVPHRQQGDLVVAPVKMSERGRQLGEPLEQPPLVVGGHPSVQHDEPADCGAVLGFDALEFGAAVAAGPAGHGRFPSSVDPAPGHPTVSNGSSIAQAAVSRRLADVAHETEATAGRPGTGAACLLPRPPVRCIHACRPERTLIRREGWSGSIRRSVQATSDTGPGRSRDSSWRSGRWEEGHEETLGVGVGAGDGRDRGCSSGGTSSGTSAATTTPSGSGKIKIIYDDAGVKPENLEAYRIVKQSGGLDRLASWVNDRIALPRDITVKVTDAVPKGVSVASFDDLEGATVWEPAAFFTDSYQAAQKLVPEVKAAGKVPSVLTDADFTPEAVLSGTMEFIFGHEVGHALSAVLAIPVLTFEEYQADGFASFATLSNPESSFRPAIQAAATFEEFARSRGAPPVSDFSSDHPIIEARIYNFLCLAVGSDPTKLRAPLIDSGFVPENRAPFCTWQWAQLDFGWWRALEPHLSAAGQASTAAVRQKAEENYGREAKAFDEELKKLREQGA